MTAADRWALAAQHWIERGGLRQALALAVLAVGLGLWLWWWPQRLALSQAQQLARWQAEQAVASAAAASARPAAAAPAARLAPGGEVAAMAAIQALATSQKLSLGRIEVQWEDNAGGHGARRVQIGLPLQAGYPAVREFMRTLQRSQPALSVDQLVIRRPAAEGEGGALPAGMLDARLLLSLWFESAAPQNP